MIKSNKTFFHKRSCYDLPTFFNHVWMCSVQWWSFWDKNCQMEIDFCKKISSRKYFYLTPLLKNSLQVLYVICSARNSRYLIEYQSIELKLFSSISFIVVRFPCFFTISVEWVVYVFQVSHCLGIVYYV